MIKKFAEFINEDFTDLYKRWKNKEVRKEDSLEVKMKDFISSKNNPNEYYIKDGLVCCKGDVTITNDDLVDNKLPFQFGEIGGSLFLNKCDSLVSLEGCPKKVNGSFHCQNCKITSLQYCPQEVKGNFFCQFCFNLTSLEGAPEIINGIFSIYGNTDLTSLEGAPKLVKSYFDCRDCGRKFNKREIKKISKIYNVIYN